MPRETIEMTMDEVRAFAAKQQRVYLSTVDSDGGPLAETVPVSFAQDRVYFAVLKQGRSLANLRRDARACCILEASPTYFEIKGVIAHGSAQEGPAHAGEALKDRVWFSLPLDDVASFDFSKIKRRNV